MKRIWTCTLLAVFASCLVACSGGNPPEPGAGDDPAAKKDTPTDDADVVKQLETLKAKVKRDGDGLIIEVDLRGTEVTDGQLAALPDLRRLRSLLLAETAVTDAGMEHVAKIGLLANLDLRECEISNAGIAQLPGLEKLRALRMSNKSGKTSVDEDSFSDIAKLKNLKLLALDKVWVGTADGMAKLAELENLEELYLANTLTDDETLAKLAELSKLKKLRVSQNNITDEGLAHLAKLKDLEELDLSEVSTITDAGMEHLSGLTKLKRLNLWRVQITNNGVAHLAPLVNLEWFNLDNIQELTDPGLVHLKGMTKLTFLHLGSTAVSDEGLKHLKHLKTLKDLKVTRTAVTADGVAALKKDLPDTDVQLEYLAPEE